MLNKFINTLKSLLFINRYKMNINSRLKLIQSNIDNLEADLSSKLDITPRFSEDLTIQNICESITRLNSKIKDIEFILANVLNMVSLINPEAIGFNSQNHRKKIFKELTAAINFENIIETGTFLGDTTYWISQHSKLPIYTTETNNIYYCISKKRFLILNNQKLFISNLDSRKFLKQIFDANNILNRKVLIYLDSHWDQDLPLLDEINFICAKSVEFVVMIDDFKVPFDEGYGFDDYGGMNVFNLEYIKDCIIKFGLSVFFPALHSSSETGAKRGCVVLTNNPKFEQIILKKVPSLKKNF